MENFQLELPRDTLIEVEIVQELRGEVSSDKKFQEKCSHQEGCFRYSYLYFWVNKEQYYVLNLVYKLINRSSPPHPLEREFNLAVLL